MSYNLTEQEAEFIRAFAASDFYNGADSKIWDFSVHEQLKIKGKARGGVVSSLVQKGVIAIRSKAQNFGLHPSYELSAEAQTSPEILKCLK